MWTIEWHHYQFTGDLQ